MPALNFETARENMITQQIRAWNVLAGQTLDALRKVPREKFVPDAYRHLAFADTRIPLGDGESMPEPKVDARMMESLQLQGGETVLLAGAGSGYLAALLATVCAHVHVVDSDARLLALAEKNLRAVGAGNVTLQNGDAREQPAQKFDAILLSRSLPKIDLEYFTALKDGGALLGVEGEAPAMSAVRMRKRGGVVTRESLFETFAPRFAGVREEEEFAF